ncbi:MAG: phosphatase PAP2 family protein, partial [Elusimicrobiaceae bacterium]|nr:phosphatase PAP2 family protein [Elusimicrobiaceae bacterium]
MDINYLLWLQDFRNSISEIWTPFMEGVSLFAISYVILIPTFIYWCLNKKKGLFVLASLNVVMAINVLIKLTACVYRPWIRDPRIIPAGNAIKTATGYSFPSGHTSLATAIYGSLAVSYGNTLKTRWVWWICIFAILLTGFSRNYLGVHTPQDVLVGLITGSFSVWLTWKLFAYAEKHPEQENKILMGGIIFVILALIYVTYKSYPVDYVDGKILMAPKHMIRNGYSNLGGLLGFCIARFAEKRWIKFEVPGFTLKSVILSLIGFVPLMW